MTAGVTSYFVWTIFTFGIARARGVTELHGGMAALVAFTAYIFTMIAVLAVSDWLSKRYPEVASSARADSQEPEKIEEPSARDQ